jgi:hypothetical protein
MNQMKPDTAKVLSTLKDFQRDTVDHVFKRMYDEDPPALRFLVADEVGLGKTLVARGIIARAIERVWDTTPRIDVIYICSNASIARQNINRLNITGRPDHRLPDRITLLPRDIRQIARNKINFVSFTPGTSFQLHSTQGTSDERELLYWLLPDDWKGNQQGAVTVLTGGVERGRFEKRVGDFRKSYSIDENLQRAFSEAVGSSGSSEAPPLKQRFVDLAHRLGRRTRLTDDERHERATLIGELRGVLAAVCIESLEPDLVILDEFQRFSGLLHGSDEASALARRLFEFASARVLLLSATPYKMYAVGEDQSTGDHYTDLVQTIAFLQNDAARTRRFQRALEGYRTGLLQYPSDHGVLLRRERSIVHDELQSVMVRTERLAVAGNRCGMLVEPPSVIRTIDSDHVDSFVRLQRISRSLGQGDTIEYWKSAPYLLNFMDDYRLKHQFVDTVVRGLPAPASELCQGADCLLLSRADIAAFRPLDPANTKLEVLIQDTIERGLWRMLWMPPSLPYYSLEGEFSAQGSEWTPTKRLVFSAWQVVPKVIAALLSYEAERRMLGDDAGPATSVLAAGRRPGRRLLTFRRAEGRPSGMPVLGLMYPSVSLVSEIDPLEWGAARPDLASLNDVLQRARRRVAELLQALPAGAGDVVDHAWYWAAPILLDQRRSPATTSRWWEQADLAGRWRQARSDESVEGHDGRDDGAIDDAWAEHVDAARQLLDGKRTLGRRPDDLEEVVAWLAVSGPGVCALRALSRICGGRERASENELRNAAGNVADGLRSLFNLPDVTALVRDPKEAVPYWRRVLEYGARGCLQAVLDEYAHVLVEYSGLAGRPWTEIADEVGQAMAAALQFRTANVPTDLFENRAGGLEIRKDLRFRSRFAVRYGGRADEGSSAKREAGLRRAFNSPFWPFVLCSTSVGQEGLDFHLYCHAVVHWNLPSNPVDLEQREGRVHRYKGHAVRKNVASRHGASLVLTDRPNHPDPWYTLFELARAQEPERASDLVPYWVYPTTGGARIERHMPMIPLSRDVERADALLRALTLYRMAFGQARQEDLVRYLLRHLQPEDIETAVSELAVDLSPDMSPNRTDSGVIPQPADRPIDAKPQEVLTLVALRMLLDEFERVQSAVPRFSAGDFARLLDDLKTTLTSAPTEG